jgi:hypothetical protein
MINSDVVVVEYVAKKTVGEKLGIAASSSLSHVASRIWSKLQRQRITH